VSGFWIGFVLGLGVGIAVPVLAGAAIAAWFLRVFEQCDAAIEEGF
jgi:hypothetical protein